MRARRKNAAPLLAVVLLWTACGAAGNPGRPAAAPSPTPTPPAGPTVEMPSGAVYRVEVARTPEEQAQGLMFRESLAPRTGMIFLFGEPAVHRFWMKNTMIPLDMIWMDATGKVVFVSANTPPCQADPCPSYGPDAPIASVLEIAGGMAEREAIKPGATLKFRDVR